jgi:hypothetical protein
MIWQKKNIILFIITIFCGCKYENNIFKYDVPDGWSSKDTVISKSVHGVIMHSPGNNDKTQTFENISIVSQKSLKITLSPYMDFMISELENRSDTFDIVADGDTTVNNISFKWKQIRVKYHESNVFTNQKIYFSGDEKYFITITATSNEGKLARLQKPLDKVLSSIIRKY